ncbi:MAG: chloride channel protein [Dehalococcoidia bacterium]
MEKAKRTARTDIFLYLRDFFRSSENTTGILLAAIVGVVAGLGAVVFRWLITSFQRIFFAGGATAFDFMGDYYVIILPALGGLIFGPMIYFFAREAKGHGVPEVMAAVAAKGGRIRSRVAVVKSLASAVCIGSGGSVGREGPIVQIGAAFGSATGQWLKLPENWVRTLVACGAAGGISATFNAPIAGVFFAQEVIIRRIVGPNFLFVVLSSVVANMVSRVFLGSSPSFTVPQYAMTSGWEILLYLLLGIVVALVAWAFIRCLYKFEDVFDAWSFPEYLKPVLGGLCIGAIGFFYPDLFGVGYGSSYGPGGVFLESGGTDKALLGELGIGLLLIMGVLKIFATSLTIGSGGSGGVFAPSLFMGAMFGGAFGRAVNSLFPAITSPSGAYAMIGMGALFAAAARAPITAFIMLFEMTRDYNVIVPLMFAVVASNLVFRWINRESIYTLKVRRLGVELRPVEERDVMRTVSVEQAMTRDFPSVLPGTPVNAILQMMEEMGHHGFPVVDGQGIFRGVVTLQDVHDATEAKDLDVSDLTVDDISTKNPFVAYPDQTLHEVLRRLGGRDFGRIPVLDRNDRTKLLGCLRRHDFLRAYIRGVSEPR